MRILSRIAATAATLSLAALLAAPAQAVAADPGDPKIQLKSGVAAAGELSLVLGSLQAFNLEESGQDEVRIKLTTKDGNYYYLWPTNGKAANTQLGTCWIWTVAAAKCSGATSQPAAGPYTRLTLLPGASFTIEVWEDDLVGDDLLLNIPVYVSGPGQLIDARSRPGIGSIYQLSARIEQAA